MSLFSVGILTTSSQKWKEGDSENQPGHSFYLIVEALLQQQAVHPPQAHHRPESRSKHIFKKLQRIEIKLSPLK